MKHQKLAFEVLTNAIGNYSGRGVNHEKQAYTGNLLLRDAIKGKMLQLVSSATGVSGEVYHNEISFIGTDMTGVLTCYVASNNHPGIAAHIFNRIEEGLEGEKKVIFRLGNPEDKNSFREEITFSVFPDQSIEHRYAWGMPGAEFETRSGARMKKF